VASTQFHRGINHQFHLTSLPSSRRSAADFKQRIRAVDLAGIAGCKSSRISIPMIVRWWESIPVFEIFIAMIQSAGITLDTAKRKTVYDSYILVTPGMERDDRVWSSLTFSRDFHIAHFNRTINHQSRLIPGREACTSEDSSRIAWRKDVLYYITVNYREPHRQFVRRIKQIISVRCDECIRVFAIKRIIARFSKIVSRSVTINDAVIV